MQDTHKQLVSLSFTSFNTTSSRYANVDSELTLKLSTLYLQVGSMCARGMGGGGNG